MELTELDTISLNLSRAEMRELLLLVLIGNHIRNSTLDSRGMYDPLRHEKIENVLSEISRKSGPDFLATDYLKYLELFVDDSFWDELEVRLGRRDFDRTMTEFDTKYLESHDGKLPPRAHLLYKKYSDEFEKYGVDRLEINTNAPVVSDLI